MFHTCGLFACYCMMAVCCIATHHITTANSCNSKLMQGLNCYECNLETRDSQKWPHTAIFRLLSILYVFANKIFSVCEERLSAIKQGDPQCIFCVGQPKCLFIHRINPLYINIQYGKQPEYPCKRWPVYCGNIEWDDLKTIIPTIDRSSLTGQLLRVPSI